MTYDAEYFKARATPHQRDFIMAAQWLERTQPKRCLDYGCGGGKHLEILKTYEVDCAGYDPNNKQYADFPAGGFDLVLCIDVLEHVPEAEIDDVLQRIMSTANKYVIFSICDSSLWGKYPDKTHVTCKSRLWWETKLADYFTLLKVPANWMFREQMYLVEKR